MQRSLIPALILILALPIISYAQKQKGEKQFYSAVVGFYNLENLYDTIDNPSTNDEEFLPNGSNAWNTPKYVHKINQLGRVISEIGTELNPDGLAVLGMCEVENKAVLEDLVKSDKIKSRNYQIVHYDGPDRRGVDVALMYNPKYFEVTSSKSVSLKLPEDPEFFTRDQLIVTGKLLGEEITYIVAHWPSRRGGEKRSAPKRIAAAKLGRHMIDSLYEINPNAKIIYMGDLNDDPVNASVKKELRAGNDLGDTISGTMYNPMFDLFKKGIGSLAYRDAWNLFDQTIISPDLIKKDYSSLRFYTAKVFNKSYLAQPDGNFKGYPFRTFSGGVWTGGFSDHFPVYMLLVRQIE